MGSESQDRTTSGMHSVLEQALACIVLSLVSASAAALFPGLQLAAGIPIIGLQAAALLAIARQQFSSWSTWSLSKLREDAAHSTPDDAPTGLVLAGDEFAGTAQPETPDQQHSPRGRRGRPQTPELLRGAPPPLVEQAPAEAAVSRGHPWYMNEQDAQKVVARTTAQDQGSETGWKHMMDKELKGLYKYSAWQRPLPSGLTEYRTVTTSPNTTPLELMEFLLDDSARQNWEAFLIRVQLLEQGDWEGHREQVVRWVRRFPFHFLSDREYLIARKVWATRGGRLVPLGQGAPNSPLYAVTKSLEEHPVAGPATVLVRTSAFDSTWRCRAVPDPWGGPNTAAEVVLLHSEDIKIPEYLAKTAVKLGMAKFVRELADGQAGFQRARRARRLDPQTPDPLGYGHDFAKLAAAARAGSAVSDAGPALGASAASGQAAQDGAASVAGSIQRAYLPLSALPGPSLTPRRRGAALVLADDERVDAASDYGLAYRPGSVAWGREGPGGEGGRGGAGRGARQEREAPVSAAEALHLHPRRHRHHHRHHYAKASAGTRSKPSQNPGAGQVQGRAQGMPSGSGLAAEAGLSARPRSPEDGEGASAAPPPPAAPSAAPKPRGLTYAAEPAGEIAYPTDATGAATAAASAGILGDFSPNTLLSKLGRRTSAGLDVSRVEPGTSHQATASALTRSHTVAGPLSMLAALVSAAAGVVNGTGTSVGQPAEQDRAHPLTATTTEGLLSNGALGPAASLAAEDAIPTAQTAAEAEEEACRVDAFRTQASVMSQGLPSAMAAQPSTARLLLRHALRLGAAGLLALAARQLRASVGVHSDKDDLSNGRVNGAGTLPGSAGSSKASGHNDGRWHLQDGPRVLQEEGQKVLQSGVEQVAELIASLQEVGRQLEGHLQQMGHLMEGHSQDGVGAVKGSRVSEGAVQECEEAEKAAGVVRRGLVLSLPNHSVGPAR
ncbi:hypothetical protein QJQ45_018641, partial [Haematococcus lacustris]